MAFMFPSHIPMVIPLEKQCGRWELKLSGGWFRVLGAPQRRGGGWRYRGRPDAALPVFWSVSSWIYRGNSLRLPAVRST